MKKKQLLCGTLLAGALVMTGCSSNEDFEVLNRDNFAENVFEKDSSQFIQFDFNSLTEKQTTELESFRELSKSIALSNFDGNKGPLTRSAVNGYQIDTSDMNQSSPLVKIINAMADPEVASALQNKDVNRYLSLLEQKGALSKEQRTSAAQSVTNLQQDQDQSCFWVYIAAAAVVAVAYAAVMADVIVIGPSMDDSGARLQETISNGDIMSLNLNQISDDEESNQIIDNTISEALVDENADKVAIVQNIAKSVYYEYY